MLLLLHRKNGLVATLYASDGVRMELVFLWILNLFVLSKHDYFRLIWCFYGY